MLMEKFFRVFGLTFFGFSVWSGLLVIGTYFSFLIYKPLAGVFIGWFVTESIYSMKKCGDISDVNKNT